MKNPSPAVGMTEPQLTTRGESLSFNLSEAHRKAEPLGVHIHLCRFPQ
jgi:hypothetical protein